MCLIGVRVLVLSSEYCQMRGHLYISTKDLAQSFTSKLYENSERKKVSNIYISGSKIKISGNSSYITIDDEAYQMPLEAIVELDDIYIPAKYFFDILKKQYCQE